MIFSKAWSYAVRSLLYLDLHRDEGSILSSQVAKEEDIPNPFLAKVLSTLVAAGYVQSTRGRNGGFMLSRSLESISLYDILMLFEHNSKIDDCILRKGKCKDEDLCPVHRYWAEPQKQIAHFLVDTKLADLRSAFPKEQN
ncbi:hypothetical protein CEE37_13530 [candidate division LCP-89 bacterium B3_LCP]|uniref:Rrf2 family transcriptional regulator n=1 Tax=candidate division LCP-89 bacterium B3_LCP TaxID=2012998 RepID=A0A532USR6_UNCL8|nr:MAG: hypothetical protein CEE37_13530 [candidate division LCP-89 bacterium B3_LCP]